MERDGRLNEIVFTLEHEFVQRAPHDSNRVAACAPVNNQLCNQRIVIRLNRQARRHSAVETNARSRRLVQEFNLAGRRHKFSVGVFGVYAALNRVAGERDIFLREVQRLARRNFNLRANQVNAGDCLGYAVLDLNARINFHEVKIIRRQVQQELDRADVGVVNALCGFDCKLADLLAHFGRQSNGRRLFQKFLVAALNRTFALAQMNHAAEIIRDDLNFNVPRTFNVMLEIKSGLRYVDESKHVEEFLLVADDEHALAAAAADGLEDDGVADLFCRGNRHAVARQGLGAFCHGNARRNHGGARRVLVADQPNRFGQRANPSHAGVDDHLREVRVLGEETVTGVNGVSLGGLCGVDYRLAVKVAVKGVLGAHAQSNVGQLRVKGFLVRVRVNRDGLNAHLLAGANDAHGNLAAVRDENSPNHDSSSSHKTNETYAQVILSCRKFIFNEIFLCGRKFFQQRQKFWR